MTPFVEYVNAFYGRDGIYELRNGNKIATIGDIEHAIANTTWSPEFGFCGDTVDREWVRGTLENNGFSEYAKLENNACTEYGRMGNK
jgi:hypothetical protein